MVLQRKTAHDRLGQEHERSLGPEMMKRPRSSKQKTPEKQRIVAKVTGRSPNYMKGTNSSEARKQSQGGSDKKMQTGKKLDSCSGDKKENTIRSSGRGVSFKRRCRVGIFGDVNAHRATCSSFLKDSKFTEYMAHTTPGVLKLCTYTYCSVHHLQFPPLKSFISTRRRSFKSQTSVKVSGEDGCVDIYVDEHENGSPREFDIQVIDSGAENMEIQWVEVEDFGSESLLEGEDSCNTDLDTPADAVSRGSGDYIAIHEQSENASDDQESIKGSYSDNSISFFLGNFPDEKLTSKKAEDWEEVDGEKVEEWIEPVSKTEDTLLVRALKPCNQEECTEDWKEFNPREPNYLPIVEEPSSEKVELKHRDMDERKNAEEWMTNYALQHTVSKLAQERKKKVALLVEAFETVLPREPSSAFTYGRHLQACS